MPRPAAAKVVYVQAPPKKKRVVRRAGGVGMIRGSGDYYQYGPFGGKRYSGSPTYNNPGIWGSAGRLAGGLAGKALAGPAGAAIGSKIGSYAHYIGKIFGSGDYVTAADNVKSNVLVNESQIPRFSTQSGKNTVHIRHREFLTDIISSGTAGAFNLQSFAIQPGLPSSLPWLSNVCGTTFQQYRINGMVFEFRSMSSDALNSTNTALGSVVMATDYDSKDASFSTKAQMENTEFGVSCKPSSCMIHAIECARSQTAVSELYIRNAAVPSGADPRLYDMGNFQIATVGFQGTSVNAGELWVSYDITLFKAIQLKPGAGLLQYHREIALSAGTTPLLADTSVHAQPQFDNIGCTVDATNKILSLPVGLTIGTRFLITYAARGASTASVTVPAVAFSQGISSHNGFQNGLSGGYSGPQAVNTSTTNFLLGAFEVTAASSVSAPPIITFSTITTPPGATCLADLYIVQMNAADGLA
nr:putative capsid protein [Crucivirus sp.]